MPFPMSIDLVSQPLAPSIVDFNNFATARGDPALNSIQSFIAGIIAECRVDDIHSLVEVLSMLTHAFCSPDPFEDRFFLQLSLMQRSPVPKKGVILLTLLG